jgi:hypothetical protein
MKLSDFNSLVSTYLKRGTSLDAIIPKASPMALSFLERNYTFKYMEVFKTVQLVQGNRTIVLPTNMVTKSIAMMRFIDSAGGYQEVNRVMPRDLKGTGSGKPQGYWLSGTNVIVFDMTPTENINGEAILNVFTTWPVGPNESHPLLIMAPDVMIYQTLINMAAYMRDSELVGAYKLMRDEGLNTLTRSDDELRYDSEYSAMAYEPHLTQ